MINIDFNVCISNLNHILIISNVLNSLMVFPGGFDLQKCETFKVANTYIPKSKYGSIFIE
jgi:hypothetical protein